MQEKEMLWQQPLAFSQTKKITDNQTFLSDLKTVKEDTFEVLK